MSWFRFKKDYESILQKEIEVEERFNPLILCQKKHRHIEDIVQDKAEEKFNFGFERFQGANPDRLKILKYTLERVQSERKTEYKKGKTRPTTAKFKYEKLGDFFITNKQFDDNQEKQIDFQDKYWRNTSIIKQHNKIKLKKDKIQSYNLQSDHQVKLMTHQVLDRLDEERMDVTRLDQPNPKRPQSKYASIYQVSDYISQTKQFLSSQKDFKIITKNKSEKKVPIRAQTAQVHVQKDELKIIQEKQGQIVQNTINSEATELIINEAEKEAIKDKIITEALTYFNQKKEHNTQQIDQEDQKDSFNYQISEEESDFSQQDLKLMQQAFSISNKGKQFDMISSIPFQNLDFQDPTMLHEKITTYNRQPLANIKIKKQYKKRPQTAIFFQ